MVSTSDAISYVKDDDDVIMTTLIGALLLLGSILIIPAFIYMGYLYRVARTEVTNTGDGSMPELTDWGRMFFDGLRVTVLVFAYTMVLLAVAVVAGLANEQLVLLVFPLVFVLSYVYPMALLHMAEEDSLAAGFNLKSIFKYAFTAKYFVTVIIVFFLSLALNIVSGILLIIPILGWIAGFMVTFGGAVVFFHLYAQAFNELKDEKDRVSDSSDYEADWS